jgi:uncharacterized protein YndB with AHSA1/START domain
MAQSTTIDVDAPIERVWDVLTDIDRWPEWTASVNRARRLDAGPLRRGSRAELAQPKLPAATWTVIGVEPGRSFTWEQRGPGVRTTARHTLEPVEGGTRLWLSIEQSGWMAWAIDLFYGRLTRRYLELESAGLKDRVEQAVG